MAYAPSLEAASWGTSDVKSDAELPRFPCGNRNSVVAQGYEIVFVTEDVEAAYRRAIENGALQVNLPETKPWGQTVGYVRDMNGALIEIASPMLPQHES